MDHPFIDHLKQDHEEQRSLGEQLHSVEQPKRRQELRQQFYEAAYPHLIGEEASIFRWMRSADEKTRQAALKALQEHHVAKLVLAELMDLDVEGEVFAAKAYVLDELNRHHMDEEESAHFPMLQQKLSAQELDGLYEEYEKAEEKAA